MSRYIERPQTVEAWQLGSDEPMPDWAQGGSYGGTGMWLVKTYDGNITTYTDEEFRCLYKSVTVRIVSASSIPDDNYKFYSGFEILDAVNE